MWFFVCLDSVFDSFVPKWNEPYLSKYWWDLFFMIEFQWFFMALSVLPFSILVKWAHWLPMLLCSRNSNHSSSSLHSVLLISGFRWLCHLSRHCFPTLPSYSNRYLVDFQRWLSTFELHTLLRVWLDSYLIPQSMLFSALNDKRHTFWSFLLIAIPRVFPTNTGKMWRPLISSFVVNAHPIIINYNQVAMFWRRIFEEGLLIFVSMFLLFANNY
jgi:hypothetical protein